MFSSITWRQAIVLCCYFCFQAIRKNCCRYLCKIKTPIFLLFSLIFIALLIFGLVTFSQLKIKNEQMIPLQSTCHQICGDTFTELDTDICCEGGSNCKTKQKCQSDKNELYTTYIAVLYSIFGLIVAFSIVLLARKIKHILERRRAERQQEQFFINLRLQMQNQPSTDDIHGSFIMSGVEGTCSICLESYLNQKIILLNCTHAFHNGCIQQWIGKNRSCPVCRNPQ